MCWGFAHTTYRYDNELRAELAAAPLARTAEEAGSAVGDVRLQYDSQPAYERHAAYFGMLQEWRDGVPRGGYKGTVRWRLPRCCTLPGWLFMSRAGPSVGMRYHLREQGALRSMEQRARLCFSSSYFETTV